MLSPRDRIKSVQFANRTGSGLFVVPFTAVDLQKTSFSLVGTGTGGVTLGAVTSTSVEMTLLGGSQTGYLTIIEFF